MKADVSKTVRFTPEEWARWSRLIGLYYCSTWAAVVNRALEKWEAQAITDGLLHTMPTATAAEPAPLFDQADAIEAPPPAEKPFDVFARQKCRRCKKDRLVNPNGNCQSCQLIEDSNGALTTADQLPPIAGALAATFTKKAPTSPATDGKPKSKPKKAAAFPASNGKVKKGGKK